MYVESQHGILSIYTEAPMYIATKKAQNTRFGACIMCIMKLLRESEK